MRLLFVSILFTFQAVQAKSNFQVLVDDNWMGICCKNNKIVVSNSKECEWKERKRFLIDLTNELQLDCPENAGNPLKCTCERKGERFHGAPDGPVSSSVELKNGAPIFSNIGRETCVFVKNRTLRTRRTNGKWDKEKEIFTDRKCPAFRIKK